MDRDGSGDRPPEELGSFDLSRMSEADVAAEIAQRMTRWRRAHRRAAATERGPPPGPAAAQPAAPPAPQPPAPQPAPDQPPPLMPELDMAKAARLERALRIAAGKAELLRAEPPVEEPPPPKSPAAILRGYLDLALRRARAIGLSGWQGPAYWSAIAGAAVVALMLAGWLLMPRGEPPVPQAARPAAAPPPFAAAPAKPASAPAAPAPQNAAAPIPETPAPPQETVPLRATLKPAWRGPTLVALLKPSAEAGALAVEKPSPAPEAAAPVVAAPSAAAPAPKPQPRRTERVPAQGPAQEGNGTGGIEDVLDWMLSDGLQRRVP